MNKERWENEIRKDNTETERRCILCGVVKPKRELVISIDDGLWTCDTCYDDVMDDVIEEYTCSDTFNERVFEVILDKHKEGLE